MASSLGISAGSQYNTDMQTYRTLLSKKMDRRVWKKSIWSDFMGIIDTDRFQKLPKYATAVSLKPTGKPIEVLRDFMNGGVDMDIPVFYPLTGDGLYGSKQMLGNEEDQKIGHKSVSVNQIRWGVKVVDNKMSKQALQDPRIQAELMKGGAEKLGDWFSRWVNYQPYPAFVEGHALHQTSSVSDGGLGLQRRSHPNFYAAGSGRVSFSTTHDTYEAAVAAAVNGLTDTSSDKFSTKAIRAMVTAAHRDHDIMPVNIYGLNLYPIVIHTSQAYQLKDDSDWNTRLQYAAERSLKENPLFTGLVAGIYEGALLLVDDQIPGVHTGSHARNTHSDGSSGVYYGSDSPMLTKDSGNYKLAILFGKSAIACGYGSQLGFETETWDYKQKQTEAGDMIVGFDRADIFDRDGDFSTSGNNVYENVSSLVLATYSPDTLIWT